MLEIPSDSIRRRELMLRGDNLVKIELHLMFMSSRGS